VNDLIVIIGSDGAYRLDTDGPESELSGGLAVFYSNFKIEPYWALLQLGFSEDDASFNEPVRFLRRTAASFVKTLSRCEAIEELREKAVVAADPDFFSELVLDAPFMLGSENLTDEWFGTLYRNLNSAFSREIAAFGKSVAAYFASKNPALHLPGRVYFHLVENRTGEEPFAFLATYTSPDAAKPGAHLPLGSALSEYDGDRRRMIDLLRTVKAAGEKSAFIKELEDNGEIFHPLKFSADEAYIFLKEIPLYEESGIICRIPDWYRKKQNSFSLTVTVGEEKKTYVSGESLLSFTADITVGGESISIDEARRMLAGTEGLALIKNRWIEVDHKKLREILDACDKANALYSKEGIPLSEAMRLQLHESRLDRSITGETEVTVTGGSWFGGVLAHLSRPETISPIDAGDDFAAHLRDYQHKGLNWLHYLHTVGLGACLADDMGLGKTIQVIAHLNHLRSPNKKIRALVIVPASLIGNWSAEIARFAPKMECHILHPSEKKQIDEGAQFVMKKRGIFIVTYSMLSRYEWLNDIEWDYLVADEAQAIKNPGTKQTRAVKAVKARFRLALTGTPVENSLVDLWSIFDFINPGLLGSAAEFSRFSKGLAKQPEGYARLKRIVTPFILRRLKSDKSIISDLPDKIEMKSYSQLSRKQALLYQSLVDSLKRSLLTSGTEIQRKGIILSSIIKFKQICNHPDQYAGSGEFAERDSGKFERLTELCETIREKRERLLVFTQFREIIDPLCAHLETLFGRAGLAIHGEVAVKNRKDIVAKFQSDEYVPFMVLSLKAGGTGLNLTAANHVIHFDRWWNPAVENQATDRAFRIGQTKGVVVHKFITSGTIEEKIDQMIEDKSKLVTDILPDVQENWLTGMSDEEIMQLVRLE